MSDLKGSFHKLKKGRYSEENIKDYLFGLKEKSFVLGSTRFLMDYYSNLLFLSEVEVSEEIQTFYSRFDQLVEDFFLKKEGNSEEFRKNIADFRTEILNAIEFFYSYSCGLDVLKYVIHRKYSLGENSLPKDLDEEAREILEFIFESQDSIVTNIRIAQVVKELPLRFTRGKFLDIVMEAIDHYQGAEKVAFENFIDRLRSSSSLKIKDQREEFKAYTEILDSYLEVDYSKLEGDEAIRLASKVVEDREKGSFGLDAFSNLMYVVNELYSITFLFEKEYLELIRKEELLLQELMEFYHHFSQFNKEKEEKFDEKLFAFEEKVEELQELLFDVEDGIFLLDTEIEYKVNDLRLKEVFILLKEITLIRANPFIRKEEVQTSQGVVDKYELEKVKEEIKKELEERLKNADRVLRKGIMAACLAELPVFLKNRTEVMDYVRSALSTCDNKEELKESLHAIRLMRRENDYNQ